MRQKCGPGRLQKSGPTGDIEMPVIFIMVFVLLFALTVGVLIWKILTGKEGRGSAEGKIYISKKGVYSESGELGGGSGEIFRGTEELERGTVLVDDGYSIRTDRGQRSRGITLKSLSNGKSYEGDFTRQLLLGRGVAGKTDIPVISLPFPSISRKHCMIFVKHSGIYAEDLKSSYGTFINEKRVTGEVRLGNGDVLQLGYEKFLVKVK